MGLMSYIHKQLLRRGKLDDILPSEVGISHVTKPELEAAKVEIEARYEDEREVSKEVGAMIRRLHELDSKNHYGESLRKAFGGS